MAWIEERDNKRWRVRYQAEDGTIRSRSGFANKTDADEWAAGVEVDQRRDVFIDPRQGDLLLSEWVALWRDANHAGPATSAKYDSLLRTHIVAKFGRQPLRNITRMSVQGWMKDLRDRHEASTVASIRSLFSTIMEEAVEERIVPINPCRKLRAPTSHEAERPVLDEHQVAHVADASGEHALMVLTAAYLGLRWGELTGMHTSNLDLKAGIVYVHPELGALHEVGAKLWIGPPKSQAAVRKVRIPPFLVDLLAEHVEKTGPGYVFTGDKGGFWRRSNHSRRHWRPALVRAGLLGSVKGAEKLWTARWEDENRLPRSAAYTSEYKAVMAVARNDKSDAMHFHDLRHTHKTWLIEDGVPEVAQAKRLGHKMRGVQGIYSHVTPEVERRLVAGLQARWERAAGVKDQAAG